LLHLLFIIYNALQSVYMHSKTPEDNLMTSSDTSLYIT